MGSDRGGIVASLLDLGPAGRHENPGQASPSLIWLEQPYRVHIAQMVRCLLVRCGRMGETTSAIPKPKLLRQFLGATIIFNTTDMKSPSL